MEAWFICENEEVSGPFSTEEVKTQVADGGIGQQSLVWGRPQGESWLPIENWLESLPELLTQSRPAPAARQWHFSHSKKSFGPMSHEQLIAEIAQLPNKPSVLIWTKGMPSWAPIYDFQNIMDALNMDRRKHARAHIDGQAVVEFDNQSHIAQLSTISSGGCGLIGLSDISPGQKVSIDIRSEQLAEPIHLKADVTFVSDDGFVGVKFQSIHSEAQAAIVDYVRGNAKAAA